MEETLAHACQRANTYKFMSECYYLPDKKLIQEVADFTQTDSFFSELYNCIPSGVEIELLKIDYSQLFVGPFKLLAPPYGSFYLDDSRIMGDSTTDVRGWYEKESLDVTIKDAPDHISMELEFMYYLIIRQIQAINEGELEIVRIYRQKQKSFLSSHPARWLPEFAKNVQENAQTEFYKKLSQLTSLFIEKDFNNYGSSEVISTMEV